MDQHNITPVENSLKFNQFKDIKNIELKPGLDYKPKANLNPVQLLFPWYYDPSDPIVLPIEDKTSDSPQAPEELPLFFIGRGEVKGREFTQFKRSCTAYLYQVQSSGVVYWEVFKRKQNQLYGNITYPSANAFGFSAWTTPSLMRATEIFERINKDGGD